MEIVIKYYDWAKLKQNVYVNDTIINFYLKFMEFELIKPDVRAKTVIFNTYFTSKICPYDKITAIPMEDK